ncbi:hypothetical protein SORBI_3010G227950 [Sorghum bicolor]|uniref:Uncharacterized protein n=1 Tax=Sorghum bicolor TaxID=4558 RepID=A0A1W0VUE1_SORBI|nr:hypothetical protein SORBI_3010G227950 [Sorghum bicolor]
MLLGDAGGRAKPNRRLLSRRGCGSAGRQLLALPSSSILPPELKTHVVVPLHACRPVPEPPSPARSSRSTCVCSFSPVQFSRLYESLRESIGWLFGCGIVLPIRHQLLAGQLGGSHACTCTQPGKEEERAHARPWPAAFSPSKRRACDEMHVLQKPSKRKFPRSSRAGAPSIPWCTSTSTTTIEYVRQCYRRRRRAGGGDDDDEDDGRDVVGSTDDWEEEARGRTTKACNSRPRQPHCSLCLFRCAPTSSPQAGLRRYTHASNISSTAACTPCTGTSDSGALILWVHKQV